MKVQENQLFQHETKKKDGYATMIQYGNLKPSQLVIQSTDEKYDETDHQKPQFECGD